MKRIAALASVFLVVGLLTATAWGTITVTVSPSTANVNTNAQQLFTATVTGTSNQVVIWSLSGPGCSGITCGSITAFGQYTAPRSVPNPPTVTVTATSIVDGTQGHAVVTVQNPNSITITISPTFATVPVNGQQQFTANVTGTQNKAVTWSLSGIGCVGNSCGSVNGNGLYTAPPVVPTPSIVTVTATSVADPGKSASATVIIVPGSVVTVTISPTQAQVAINGQQQFTATVVGNPNTSVTWSLSGTGCSGAGCGTITNAGLYTAPASVPSPPTVTVKATSVADPSKFATAVVTVVSGPTVTVTPPNAQVQVGQQQQFTANVTGTQNKIVVWSVSGSGCVGLACGTVNSNGLYTAPATVPNPPTVAVTATLLSDPHVAGSATVTVTSPNAITVTVSPATATVGTGAQQQFTASVNGTDNKAVTWSISGIGCYADICGTIDQNGLYTAPANVPNPSFLNVIAKSVADPSKSGSAFVSVIAQITVTISPTTATVQVGNQQQFTANVTGTVNKAVTWSVSGPGCAGVTCGTVTSNGLYTAPANPPSPPTVNVQATSQADNSRYAIAVVTVVSPIVVTVSPPSANVTTGGTQQFTASVTGTNDKRVTWSVQGSGCTGSACGTIDQTGLYTAPIAIPSPPAVTVIATSVADNSSFGTASVTISPTGNSKLNGQYAFLLKGFDILGPYQVVGSFKADGQGNITWGLEDVSSFLVSQASVAFTGKYQIGGDSRGTLNITSALGTFTYTLAVDANGKSGRLISFDGTGIQASGEFKQQDPNAFNTGALTGGYAIALSGLDLGGGQIGAVGAIFPSGSGFVAGSSLDVNDAGNLYSTFASFPGSYSVDATGRGTMSFNILGLGSGTVDFAIYVISADEFYLVSTDKIFLNQFIFGGYAVAQTGSPYSQQSFNGNSVYHLTGLGSFPDVKVGRFAWDGAGNLVMLYDENNGGKIQVSGLFTGAYDMQLNGRGTLNLVDPNNEFDRPIWFIYAIAPNRAFVLESTSINAGVGELKAQLVTPPFSNTDIVGNYLFGSGEMAAGFSPIYSGTAYFDGSESQNGLGNVTGSLDENTGYDLLANQAVIGTYFVSAVSNNGRGSMLLTSPQATYSLWVISESEWIALDLDKSNSQPTVLQFQKE